MSKRFLLIMAGAIAIFIGLVIVNKQGADAPGEDTTGQVTNHVFGEGSTGVNVTEYGDLQCPACASYFPIFSQLKEEYGDRVTFQFRHFPLVAIHQNAMAAHRAAEAAGLQDKFWEMHDLMYQNQGAWKSSNNPSAIFESYAQQLNLDIEKFQTDAAGSLTNASIQADIKAGQDLGVSGTPTFTLDGKVIETPRTIEAFREVIDNAIKEKTD